MDLIKVAEEAFATGKKFPEFKAGDTITVAYKIVEGTKAKGKVCPVCGQETLVYQEGCLICTNCGTSRCG